MSLSNWGPGVFDMILAMNEEQSDLVWARTDLRLDLEIGLVYGRWCAWRG